MNKKNKILMPILLVFSVASTIALISYSFASSVIQTSNILTTKNKEIGWTREDESKNIDRYLNDALAEDVLQKANTNSVLFYKIEGYGVIPKFAFISHMMEVLKINPKKEIRIYANEKLNLNMDYFKQFPNVVFTFFPDNTIDSYAAYEFGSEFLQEVYSEFGQDKIIDGYFDDTSFFRKIEIYLSGILTTPKSRLEIYNEFHQMAQLNTINFFSDGTASIEYFREEIKKSFLISNNLYDKTKNNYINAKQMREGVKNGTISKKDFIQDNNALLFLTSLVTIDFDDINKTKYFFPTTDFIEEVNRKDDNHNFDNYENDVFSPFNSLNMNLNKFISGVNQKDIMSVLKIKENFDPQFYIDKMNNNLNYVYAGGMMRTTDLADANARVLLAIKANAIKEYPNNSNIIVWFKGHPRDKDILSKLQDAVIRLTNGQDQGEWINVLDHEVPFEFYSISGVFSPDILNKKEVFVFTTYSSLVLTMHGANQSDYIAKIIIDNESFFSYNRIIEIYGMNSTIFPSNKLTTLEDFQNSAK